MPSESSPRDWYLVGIVPIHSNGIHILLNVFGKLFVHGFHKHPYLPVTHCAQQGRATQVCAPGMHGGLFH